MGKIKENFGYWTAAPYGDGWATFERANEDGSKSVWHEVAQTVCPLDANGQTTSSKHPFYARVDASGTVLNCYDDIWKLVPHENTVIAVDSALEAGARLVDGKILPPLPKVEFFPPISRKQFAYVVAQEGIISFDEALDWAVSGKLPAILLDVIEAIPDDAVAFDAKMHLAASNLFERDHPLTPFVGYLLSTEKRTFDKDAIDEIWRKAAKIV